MRTAIYGAGAMGTVLGAYISRAGRQIDLITRNASHVRALNTRGATVTGSAEFTVPVTALTPDMMQGKYDIIFLMTKQRNNSEICEFLKDFLDDNGVICTMQNGLPEPSVSAVVGESRCLGCAVSWGATFIGDGVSELTSNNRALTFALGAFRPGNRKLEAVKELLSCMGEVEIESNFIGARWSKLAVNSAFSSLSAITGLTFGEISSRKDSRVLALGLLNEAFAVAEKCGVKLEKIQGHDIVRIYSYKGKFKKAIALRLLPSAMKNHKNLVSGMYFDLKTGKKSDIDHINGVILHSARNFGVSVPLNVKVLEIARSIEKGERAVGIENLTLFE